MSKRFGVVKGELAAVEEVSGGGDNFIADDSEEVSDFDRQITVGGFGIQLGDGMAIGPTRSIVKAIVPVSVGNTEGLGVRSVGTVQVVNTSP